MRKPPSAIVDPGSSHTHLCYLLSSLTIPLKDGSHLCNTRCMSYQGKIGISRCTAQVTGNLFFNFSSVPVAVQLWCRLLFPLTSMHTLPAETQTSEYTCAMLHYPDRQGYSADSLQGLATGKQQPLELQSLLQLDMWCHQDI